jgi:hypothetical protein
MAESIAENDDHRKSVVRTVYDIAKGSERYLVSPEDVRRDANLGAWSKEYFDEIVKYDVDEGLLKYTDKSTLGITHNGIKQVEAERRVKPTTATHKWQST